MLIKDKELLKDIKNGDATVEPIIVCRMMGHTSVKQTEEYMKVLDNTVFATEQKKQPQKYDTPAKRLKKILGV